MSNTQSLTYHKFRQFRSVDNLTSIAREIVLTSSQATKSMSRYNVMRSPPGSVDTESLSSEKGGYHRTEDNQPAHPFSFFGRPAGKILWTSGNLRLTVSAGVTRAILQVVRTAITKVK